MDSCASDLLRRFRREWRKQDKEIEEARQGVIPGRNQSDPAGESCSMLTLELSQLNKGAGLHALILVHQ